MEIEQSLLLFGLVAAYFLPAIIAAWRQHHNTAAIAALNLLLGWTLLGWVAAFVWALTTIEPDPAPAPRAPPIPPHPMKTAGRKES